MKGDNPGGHCCQASDEIWDALDCRDMFNDFGCIGGKQHIDNPASLDLWVSGGKGSGPEQELCLQFVEKQQETW